MTTNNNQPQKLFSNELRASAEALQRIRTVLVGLINEETYPAPMFADMSTILNEGWHVIEALQRLASK